MRNRAHKPGNHGRPEMKPHERFLELCALSTSSELSDRERKELDAHLAGCPGCQRALQEFESTAALGVPLLHTALASSAPLESETMPSGSEEEASQAIRAEVGTAGEEATAPDKTAGPLVVSTNGRRRVHLNWNYVWMPFAAAVVLTISLGIYSYQVGRRKALEATRVGPTAADSRVDALEQQMSDLGHEREVMKSNLGARDHMIAELKREIAAQCADLSEAKRVQVSLQLTLENTLQSQAAERQRLAQQESDLSQQLAAAQASQAKTQTELASLEKQRSEDQSRAESLETQINDLHGQLRDREQALDKEEELLAHDRDIRELMGARELYIAEVYDVARDGQTKKPFGRVFYTRGRSLVFYAYDLDQQAGLKNASTFQAWGSRDGNRQQATSLGIFYEDNAAKKRWVLKSDDPKKLEQIDAVFVTVEPNGGSVRPSGKPLLFAYLKVEPNHP